MLLEVSCLFISFLATSNAANILILSALPAFSHHKWNGALGEALGARNHSVTIFSPYFVNAPPNGVQYIFIDSKKNAFREFSKKATIRDKRQCPLLDFLTLALLTREMCFDVIETAGFQRLLNYPNDAFDLIIHDFTGGACLVPFVHKFKYVPLVIATPFSNAPFMTNIMGNDQGFAHVPHLVLPFNKNMTFFQRYINFLIHLIEHYGREYVLLKELDFIMVKYFGPDMPPISQLEKRAALALIGSHPIIDNVRPLLETIIPVAGMHIKEATPLPTDLELFLNSSKKGAILFSLGSAIYSEDMPSDKQRLFLNIFSELTDYNFLWKFESDLLAQELPQNVWISAWIPQFDVLANSKVKAFITHGGISSIIEAIETGIPMVVIPLLMDQIENMNKVKNLEIAESLDFYSLSYNNTKETIEKVLENPKYATNARKISAAFKDQKEKPIDRAVWRIEWLLRNSNVSGLRSPVHKLGYFTGNSLDIITFATVIFILQIIILCKLVHYVYEKCVDIFFKRMECQTETHKKQN